MEVYLIKTPEYDKVDFLGVFEILNSSQGPITFKCDLTDFSIEFPYLNTNYPSKNFPLYWEQLFEVCRYFRKLKHLNDEVFVVILTSRSNELNWFSSFEQSKRNIFVHTGDWELFVHAHHKYPVAHNVVENILNVLEKSDLDQLYKYTHKQPIGCYNDFCLNKSQVILKLRTADICPVCLERLKNENVEPAIISQALSVFENIRKQTLFSQGFSIVYKISRIQVNKDYRIFFPDYGNIELTLPPIYKALYLLYLEHPEGVEDVNLDKYKKDLYDLYADISPNSDSNKMKNSIERLCNSLEGSLREKRAYINSAIEKKLGVRIGELASTYKITGEKGQPRTIRIEKDKVVLCYR